LADRLGVKVVGIYKDNDISASTRSRKTRPDYQRLLADARVGLVKVIISYTSSRITRKPREHEDLIDLAVEHGVWFEYLRSPSFDLNTADGRRIARMLAANDAGEAEATAERVARAKLQMAKAGKWHGGVRPYGYEKGGITIYEPEAAVIKKCVARLVAGETMMSVVRSLNERGIPTKDGKKWSVGNMKRTITKKRYVVCGQHLATCDDGCQVPHGFLEHNPENGPRAEFPAEWPAFISLEDYTLMMQRLKAAGQPWAQRRYRCRGLDNHAQVLGCGKVFRDATALDDFVTEAVLTRFDSPDIAHGPGVVLLCPF
jgi:DNA invertase Pin-like site-specific DNA recombinase